MQQIYRGNNLNSFILIFFRKGLLFISHGLGEHSGYYEEFASFLSSHGFIVFSHDHGNSYTVFIVKFPRSLYLKILCTYECGFAL